MTRTQGNPPEPAGPRDLVDQGPLAGVKVVELAGIGPCPFAGMLLSDLGADVVQVRRPGFRNPGNPLSDENDMLSLGRPVVEIDLKTSEGTQELMALVTQADALIEGFRPGVMERLGVGPEECMAVAPALVYGRVTGYGQNGPWARTAGHDINYIAMSGVLATIGTGEAPVIPLNLIGDFGGGGMLLVVGILAALHEARESGLGQVVDAAMIEGAALLATMVSGWEAQGMWSPNRASNLLDGGCHYYNAYRCADGAWLVVGAIEPKFYANLLAALGLEEDSDFTQGHQATALWPTLTRRLRETFETRPRAEWMAVFDGAEACVTPLLSRAEAPHHPHHVDRRSFTSANGATRPSPAPRFSRTRLTRRPVIPKQVNAAILSATWGIPREPDHWAVSDASFEPRASGSSEQA